MKTRSTPTPEQLIKKAKLLRERADTLDRDARAARWEQTFTIDPPVKPTVLEVLIFIKTKYVESGWGRFIPRKPNETTGYRALAKLGYLDEYVTIMYGDDDVWVGPRSEAPRGEALLEMVYRHTNGEEIDQELIYHGSSFLLSIKGP